MAIHNEVTDNVEFHCTRCCGPDVMDRIGCQCNEMNDGIVTIFKSKGPHWMCRPCSKEVEKGNIRL